MSNPFHFKQFTVQQENAPFKVGTDGVLIGSWAKCTETNGSILDIGTGTGLISLMLAQRFPSCKITAIEINSDAASQAKSNFEASPWKDRIQLIHSKFQECEFPNQFDLIVCNPPFFSNSQKGEQYGKNLARHEVELNLNDLIFNSKRLLQEKGNLSLVIPFDRLKELEQLVAVNKLNITRKCEVSPKPSTPPKRVLLEISKKQSNLKSSSLVLELERHKYSVEYNRLTKDFYLKG
ncbi:MAG: tRNA1(Val) (adenine(37)-N6)-methyltransferase [Salibacteraceae bacterium]